ncbi:hypothetical protein DMC30DRAFT_406858 [Rhodotorula diobovata]|uniref:Uncharacterized protein n=1 Tax=Rhodotorula diobovata TaxID=5288 RepID=A0A5C5FJT9_9BASI|nr:hypothetical protein DMC30DRAFT_406858 [Rhodotorula diobovata]
MRPRARSTVEGCSPASLVSPRTFSSVPISCRHDCRPRTASTVPRRSSRPFTRPSTRPSRPRLLARRPCAPLSTSLLLQSTWPAPALPPTPRRLRPARAWRPLHPRRPPSSPGARRLCLAAPRHAARKSRRCLAAPRHAARKSRRCLAAPLHAARQSRSDRRRRHRRCRSSRNSSSNSNSRLPSRSRRRRRPSHLRHRLPHRLSRHSRTDSRALASRSCGARRCSTRGRPGSTASCVRAGRRRTRRSRRSRSKVTRGLESGRVWCTGARQSPRRRTT